MDPNKIQSIREYLQKHFADAHHADKEDFDRIGHKFRITTKSSVLLTSISRELIDDNDSETIISKLDNIDLVNLLKGNPESTVIVRRSGVSFVKRY